MVNIYLYLLNGILPFLYQLFQYLLDYVSNIIYVIVLDIENQ